MPVRKKRGRTRSRRPDEEFILRKIQRAFRLPDGKTADQLKLAIGDDAALFLPAKGYETVLTCDWFLEGTHFTREKHPADSVGWKCLARAASDVAAMGGAARCFLLGIALPEKLAGAWLDQFLLGLRRASRKLQCALAGGDTTRAEKLLINVSVIGELRAGTAKRRSGARAGDAIFVSGRLGEAEAGWQMLRKSGKKMSGGSDRLRKHLYPEPRLALGQWLSENRIASSMMDLSDGLSSDLTRLCQASGVGARIDSRELPLTGFMPRPAALQLALHGGEDYELLFTVPRRRVKQISKLIRGTLVTQIGTIVGDQKLILVQEDGREEKLGPGGWDPFQT